MQRHLNRDVVIPEEELAVRAWGRRWGVMMVMRLGMQEEELLGLLEHAC